MIALKCFSHSNCLFVAWNSILQLCAKANFVATKYLGTKFEIKFFLLELLYNSNNATLWVFISEFCMASVWHVHQCKIKAYEFFSWADIMPYRKLT